MGKHNKLNQCTIDQIKNLKKEGKSNAAIARATGINPRTVKDHCRGMHPVPEPFTAEQISEIREMRSSGNILRVIASKFNCSPWRIQEALKIEPTEIEGTEILNYKTYGDAFIYNQ